jgi:hypothetical protein
MLTSLIEAGEIFNEQKYTNSGLSLAKYLDSFNQNNQLYRVSIDNNLQTLALFEDYVYLANAYLSVFDNTNNQVWLDKSIQLVNSMNEKFWDKVQYGFNMTNDKKYLNSNYKESYDGAIPSTNGVAYQVLVKLSNRVNEPKFAKQAQQLLNAFATEINQYPYNYSSFILGINNANFEELANVQYAYNGRVRIQTKMLGGNQLLIDLELKPLWHINSNQPLQNSLIATKITNLDTKNWSIIKATYPQGELIKLGFSKEQISIYKNQASIKIKLKQSMQDYVLPTLSLTLQACSDKVCLPPTSVILKP